MVRKYSDAAQHLDSSDEDTRKGGVKRQKAAIAYNSSVDNAQRVGGSAGGAKNSNGSGNGTHQKNQANEKNTASQYAAEEEQESQNFGDKFEFPAIQYPNDLAAGGKKVQGGKGIRVNVGWAQPGFHLEEEEEEEGQHLGKRAGAHGSGNGSKKVAEAVVSQQFPSLSGLLGEKAKSDGILDA